ncbi:PREDICTED: uncharacterized protein LOC107171129 [Diuraphis noxia]|uniref:uncharacterized protein LOC107171129 n=1 Tax=Diuraphis noxia TaxID=143948 RepID=UPI000763939B|nr:PREDICTED: uncharacterized protein LOC107171129 [Diuraphis noxia]
MNASENKNFTLNKKFAGCIPLKQLFGFCEDYKKILLNCNQQIILNFKLNRSSTDSDALYVSETTANDNIEKLKKVVIELCKIFWKMPVIRVSDKEKIKLLKVLDSRKQLSCAFRNWDLCEYPVLPQNTSHSWTVKSSSLLEKPRFALIGFQTDRTNNLFNPSGRFDHCYLKNLKIHLNSEVYPYEDFRSDFTNNVTALYIKHIQISKNHTTIENIVSLYCQKPFLNNTYQS